MAKSNCTNIENKEFATLQNLLAPERRQAVEWWSLLHEMRLRGELPDWVRSAFPDAGSSDHMQERRKLEQKIDRAISGEPQPCGYSLAVFGDAAEEVYLITGGSEVVEFQGSVVDLAMQGGVLEQLSARQLQAVACGLRDYAKNLEVSHA